MKGDRLNDQERHLWILNDESLYNWYRSSRQSMRAFIRENRDEIDSAIRKTLAPPPERDWRYYARGGA